MTLNPMTLFFFSSSSKSIIGLEDENKDDYFGILIYIYIYKNLKHFCPCKYVCMLLKKRVFRGQKYLWPIFYFVLLLSGPL